MRRFDPDQLYVSPRVLVRDLATAALQAMVHLPGLDGLTVEQSRAIGITDAQLPFLGVYAVSQSSELQNEAGTEPIYLATAALHLVCRARSQVQAESEATIDAIADGAINLLMTDGRFINAPGIKQVRKIEVAIKVEGDKASGYQGDAVVTLHVELYDRFAPPATDCLVTVASTIAPFAARNPDGSLVRLADGTLDPTALGPTILQTTTLQTS